MVSWATKKVLNLVFGSFRENVSIKEEFTSHRMESARKMLLGERTSKEIQCVTSKSGRVLARRVWSPPRGTKVVGLIYICHGFTEHMGNYNGVAEYLSSKGYYCFGTDLVGHGLSDMIDGLPAFIPDFKECHDDIIDHIKYEQEMIENHYGLKPPLFIIGHSMGGMLTIRLVIDNPDLFKAVVLIGPLIYPGPSEILKNVPMSSIMSPINTGFQWILNKLDVFNPYLDQFPVSNTKVEKITTDEVMQQLLVEDELRYFGGAYVKMLRNFCAEVSHNLERMPSIKTPFCIMFGQLDELCNIKGAWDMYHKSQTPLHDKKVVEFEHAGHQLYLEIPQVREKALKDTLDFFQSRVKSEEGFYFDDFYYSKIGSNSQDTSQSTMDADEPNIRERKQTGDSS